MKRVKRILKMIGLTILSIILLLILIVVGFMYTSPQFGGKVTEAQKVEFAKTGHYKDGKFVNELPSELNFDYIEGIRKWFSAHPGRDPLHDISVLSIDSADIEAYSTDGARLTWFGHSTFLLEMEGMKILLDPMFGKYPSPHSLVGPKRFSAELPIEIEKLPHIDAVFLSHDHYDHLDMGSIKRLKSKVDKFLVPLGLENHLIRWGVPIERIEVFDWWDVGNLGPIEFACTPARHFSGRGFSDNAATLWASWVIMSKNGRIYFSGDSGYGPHFKRIGDMYGPFDIGLMECGQYNEDWHAIHMMPEESALAGVDTKSKVIMPIHWGAWSLAYHTWTDPVERVTKAASELGVQVATPRIGEPFNVKQDVHPSDEWWTEFK